MQLWSLIQAVTQDLFNINNVMYLQSYKTCDYFLYKMWNSDYLLRIVWKNIMLHILIKGWWKILLLFCLLPVSSKV